MTRFLLVCLFAMGCGGPPSSLDACKHGCDKEGSCTNATSSEISACKTVCDGNKTQLADLDQQITDSCNNASEVRQKSYDCFGNYCDSQLATQCANAIYCEPK